MVSFRDWVVETSSTTGTGDYSLSGSPPAGTSYFTFRQRYSNGDDEVCYWVVNADRTKWEKNRFGTLTYGTTDTLSRNVVESTNGDAPVSWVGGDTPLRLYVVPDADAEEFAISMGLGTSRPDVLKFGPWADLNGLTSNYDLLNFFDGTSDHPFGAVNKQAHEVTLYGFPNAEPPTLSRPSTTTLTASAGSRIDSTNVVVMRLGSAMTKSTAGTWVAGSGNNGMGQGLTIANNTWYHVFLILVAGVADVYLDTSFTAANKPTGTTHFKRIGSVKTNGSAQIIDFIQDRNRIRWVAATTDFNSSPLTSPITVNVPTGLSVLWDGNASVTNSAGLFYQAVFYDFGVTTSATFVTVSAAGTATNVNLNQIMQVKTSTTATIVTSASGTPGAAIQVYTSGWTDTSLGFGG